jgi:hypothetical protein
MILIGQNRLYGEKEKNYNQAFFEQKA